MKNFAAELFFPRLTVYSANLCFSFSRERLFISLSCAIKNNQRQGDVALEKQQKGRHTRLPGDATEGEVNNSINLTECNIIREN